MASIVVTVMETGQNNVTKTLNLSDIDLDTAIESYNLDASLAIFGSAGSRGTPAGIASRNQTLNYMFNTLIVSAMQVKVQEFSRVPTSVPPPISIT